MNYLYEILAFEQWLETHYLPISPQLLWYKLLYLCNRSGWSEWVTVDNLRLMAAMQMSREATLIKARDDLIKAGLIDYQKGKKGSPNRYHMVSLADKNTFKSEVQSEVKSGVYPVVQSGAYPAVKGAVESADIYKQKHKQNITPLSPVEHFEEFVAAYPKPVTNQYLAQQAYCRVLLEDCHLTEQDLVAAARNYADAVKTLGRPGLYIRSPESFLSGNFFADYLEGSYKRPEPPKKKYNANKGMESQSYDFDALESELLSN